MWSMLTILSRSSMITRLNDMQQEDRVFYLSSEEAEVIAKAETGIGDLPRQLSMGMVIMLMAVIILRIIMDLPLPSFRMLGAYMVAIVAWITLVSFSRVRISRTAEEMKNKPFYLKVSETGIFAGKFSDDFSYHSSWNDIQVVEKGTYIYRITSPMGRLCLPRTALSSVERDKLESLEAIQVEKKWM